MAAMRQGVLGMLGNLAAARSVVGDPEGKGGFPNPLPAVIIGPNGLKHGSIADRPGPGVGSFGFSPGIESGPGDGSEGMDEAGGLIENLMQPMKSEVKLPSKTGPPHIASLPDAIPVDYSATFTKGERKKSEIMQVVMANIGALRYAYNKRLRDQPGLKGTITLRFAIDEFGKVVRCEIAKSTINDPQLEAQLITMVIRWRFDRIDNPGDITEVIYPFVFSS